MKTDENRRGLKLMKAAGPERYETWWEEPPDLIIYENWWKPLGPKIDEKCRARKVWNLMKTAGT